MHISDPVIIAALQYLPWPIFATVLFCKFSKPVLDLIPRIKGGSVGPGKFEFQLSDKEIEQQVNLIAQQDAEKVEAVDVTTTEPATTHTTPKGVQIIRKAVPRIPIDNSKLYAALSGAQIRFMLDLDASSGFSLPEFSKKLSAQEWFKDSKTVFGPSTLSVWLKFLLSNGLINIVNMDRIELAPLGRDLLKYIRDNDLPTDKDD
jgi:hypothetical protein